MSQQYEVEKIIGKRTRFGKTQYRVVWKGYPKEADYTWENAANVRDCTEALAEFERSQRALTPVSVPSSSSSTSRSTAASAPRKRGRRRKTASTLRLAASAAKKSVRRSATPASPVRRSSAATRSAPRSPSKPPAARSASTLSSSPERRSNHVQPGQSGIPSDQTVYDERSYIKYMKAHRLVDKQSDKKWHMFGWPVEELLEYRFGSRVFVIVVAKPLTAIEDRTFIVDAAFAARMWPRLIGEASADILKAMHFL